MRIAVCDDNAIDREIVCSMLKECCSEADIQLDLAVYSTGLVLVDDVVDGEWFDVIFLDIYMDDDLGIDIAHRLRDQNYDGEIVFLTASADFAIDGYKVSAAGYILKPLSIEKLNDVLTRVSRNIHEETYAIRQRSALIRVPLSEIMYVESNNNRCILHRSNGTDYTIYKRLGQIEEELTDKRFLRCAQSYIVNMDYVQSVDKMFHLTTGEVVLIRQRSLKAIKETYFNYMKERRRS